jgi:hypothetical protein
MPNAAKSAAHFSEILDRIVLWLYGVQSSKVIPVAIAIMVSAVPVGYRQRK